MTQETPSVISGYELLRQRVRVLDDLHEGPKHFGDVVALGSAAIPVLEELLRGRSEVVFQPRCLAADAIAAIGGAEAHDALLRALDDCVARELPPVLEHAEIAVVNRIAGHLGDTRHPRAADALLAALHRRNYPGCAAALGQLRDERAIPLLVRCLADDYAREAAMKALRGFGATAIAALTRALDAPSQGAGQDSAAEIGRAAVAELLGWIGGRFVHQALLRALQDRNRHVRLAAAKALAKTIGPDRDRALPVLIELLDDEDWSRAERAADVLQTLGVAAMRALACAIAEPARGVEGARRRKRAERLLRQMRKQFG